ncbi:MAG: PilN domain-containing protein [Fibrobacteria bacterium]|nr:PilN domain-containing protein [Fibrobacteria bacterium]
MSDLIEINLLPVENRKIRKDYTYLLDIKAVLPTLVLVVTLLCYQFGNKYIDNRIEASEKTLEKLDNAIKENQPILARIATLEKLLQEKEGKNISLKSITQNKKFWVRLMEGCNKSMPANTWLTEIIQVPENESQLRVKGATYLFSEVAVYMIDLEAIESINQVQLEKIEVDPLNKSRAFFFNLVLQLNLTSDVGSTIMPQVPEGLEIPPGEMPEGGAPAFSPPPNINDTPDNSKLDFST